MDFNFAERILNVRDSHFMEMLDKADSRLGMISFAAGMPTPEHFPVAEINKAAALTLETESDLALQYGATEGLPLLKEIIIKNMREIGIKCKYENILLTTGSQQALDLVAKLFINDHDTIIVEEPMYIGAIAAYEPYQPNFVSVQMDENGIISEKLEQAMKENPGAKFVYIIPDYQNPTGKTISIERRKKILELSYQYNIPILEDAPYNKLVFEGEEMPSIKSFDDGNNVIYLGTFSKILCPALRIGWMIADESIIKKCALLKMGADLNPSMFLHRLTANILQSYDVKNHLKQVNALYKKRRDLMYDCLLKEAPKGVKFLKPNGGLFIWLEIEGDFHSYTLMDKLLEEGVAAIPGDGFFAREVNKCCYRLNFSFTTEDNIIEGIRRLGIVIKKLL